MLQRCTLFCLLLFALGLPAQNHHLQLRSVTPFPGELLAGVWGYVQDGREYALVAGDHAVHIVDVTNPDAPKRVVDFPRALDWGQEIRTYRHYAYVSDEASENMLVIDLSALPSTHFADYSIKSVPAGRAHTLHVDTAAGFVYLNGGFYNGTGVYDLNIDPFNPPFAGKFVQLGRIHDGYADGDTLYAAHINAGYVSVVDFRDKSNPVVLTTFDSPGRLPHNTWLTDDRRHLLVADEVGGGFLTCYDVSDLENVTETDRFQPTPGSGSSPHNIFPVHDFAVAAWYSDGLVVVDVSRPQNLVEVGRYDFHAGIGSGFKGAWGTYPWLPSGNLLVNGIEEGLHVLTPQYQRAAWLEGKVQDATTGLPLTGVGVTIRDRHLPEAVKTNSWGEFKTGCAEAGTVEVVLSKIGYWPQTVQATLKNGEVTQLNAALRPAQALDLHGFAYCHPGGQPLANTPLVFTVDTFLYEVETNADGFFRVAGLWPGESVVRVPSSDFQPLVIETFTEMPAALGFLPPDAETCSPAPLHFAAFPNPFHTSCTVAYHLSDDLFDPQMVLFNALGQAVVRYRLPDESGVLGVGEGLPAGVYFLTLFSDGRARETLSLLRQ